MKWLLIDGYSLLHRHPEMDRLRRRDFMMARERLVVYLSERATGMAERITVVFDGQRGGPAAEYSATSIEVLFSPRDQTADTVIERLVYAHPHPEEVTVVTSDRGELDTVTAVGAHGLSCDEFLDQCRAEQDSVATRLRNLKGDTPGGTLGDFFPE